MENCNCGGDLSKERMLLVNLAKEIDCKNLKLREMELNMEEISATNQKRVQELEEQVDYKDKIFLEMQAKYHEKCTTIVQMKNEKNMLFESMNEKDWQCRKYLKEIQMLLSTNDKLEAQKIFAAQIEKRQKEELLSEIIQLQKKLDAKQLVEMELEQLKGTLNVMKNVGDVEAQKKMEQVLKALGDKEEELEDIQALNQTLMVKERNSNDELHEARKESITCLRDMLTSRSTLQIKQMGEIDPKPFQDICSEKFRNEDWEVISAELYSTWAEKLKNPHWHPFKQEDSKGKAQVTIDEDDETLKGLRDAYGEAVHKAVADALLEMNEYNPSGRYTVPEVWKVKEGRKATLKEIIGYLLIQLKTHKRKRKRT